MENTFCESGKSTRKLRYIYYTPIVVVDMYMGFGLRNLRRDEEDDQADILNIDQKRPNTGYKEKSERIETF